METEHCKRLKKLVGLLHFLSFLSCLTNNNNIISIKSQLEHIWNDNASERILTTARTYTREVMVITIECMTSIKTRNEIGALGSMLVFVTNTRN